jgi:hypothetical protein
MFYRSIIEAFQKINPLELEEYLKEHLILVLSRVRPNGTIEDVTDEHREQIDKAMEFINKEEQLMHHHHADDKIIISGTPHELEELKNLEKIFGRRPTVREDNRYGELMGYPECCRFPNLRFDKGFTNPIGVHLMQFDRWPWFTCFANKTIFHIPHAPDCEETIEIGKEHLFVKALIQDKKTIDMIPPYAGYMLHFSDNQNILFSGEKKGNTYTINEIIAKRNILDINTYEKEKKYREKHKHIIDSLKKGSQIFVSDFEITHLDGTYAKEDESDGCIITYNK